jgi:Heme/copper-type cytochrome/quinol oxidases, subunit 1
MGNYLPEWHQYRSLGVGHHFKRYPKNVKNQTVAGWTFGTPLSVRTKSIGYGTQDMLILAVYLSGISTTISVVNLLVTRRTLAAPGLKNRRLLLPFITISILLMLRTLSLITPVLGSAMLMLFLDRH